MHEMSIAQGMIDAACEAAAREGARRVLKLRARIGLLSGVAKTALAFSFDLAVEGTACQGAVLEIEDVPITVMCAACNAPQVLPGSSSFCCPRCGAPTPEILSGQELELVSLEIDCDDDAHCGSPGQDSQEK